MRTTPFYQGWNDAFGQIWNWNFSHAFSPTKGQIDRLSRVVETEKSAMSDIISGSDPSVIESKSNFDSSRISDVKAWLASQFDAAGKDVPDFEYTPRTIAHLHNLSTLSQAKTQAAGIVATDFRQKAAEYRCQGSF